MPSSVAISLPVGTGIGPCRGFQLVRPAHAHRQEVHRRRADEPRDKAVRRVLVQLHRRADLFDPAVVEHHDPVGQRHRLDLVMGHIDHRRAEPLVQPRDLQPHLHAQRGVEVRQRLVEQEHLRVADDGAADGDALALPARQVRAGSAPSSGVSCSVSATSATLPAISARSALQLQAEADVLGHRHVRKQRVGLEHHGDAAVGRARCG